MTTPPHPRIKLSKLRDIGCSLWDPIGLLSAHGPFSGHWSEPANRTIFNEYDNYLIAAASDLRAGTAPEAVAASLARAQTELMGMPGGPAADRRARAVIAAILADPEIWTWPDEEGRIP